MPTLRELFENKNLSERGGKTAKEAFEVRDSKNIEQRVANPLINFTGLLARKGAIKAAQLLPIDTRNRETLVEELTTGVNTIRLGSLPVIYGTELTRISLRTTPTLDTMKERTVAPLSSSPDAQTPDSGVGGLGSKISSVRDKTKTALGIPTPITPSFVEKQFNDTDLKPAILRTQFRPNQLDLIKERAQGVAANPVLGWIGENVSGGTPSQIGKQAVGGLIRGGKKFIRNKAFGANQEAPNGLEIKGNVVRSNSYDWTLTTTGFTPDSFQFRNSYGVNYGAVSDETADPVVKPGQSYSEQGGLQVTSQLDKRGSTYTNPKNIKPWGDQGERNDLSEKQVIAYTRGEDNEGLRNLRISKSPERVKKFAAKEKDRTSLSRDLNKNEFIENARGLTSIRDEINSVGVYDDNNPPIVLNDKKLEDVDFVPFKIKSLVTNKAVNFRTIIEGDVSDDIEVSWDKDNFVGSPFSFYTYQSVERGTGFDFIIYSSNANEHKTNWEKLNFLTSLVYPQGYYETSAVKPPLVEFTLGDLYRRKTAIIDQISYTYVQDGGWQINTAPKATESFTERFIASEVDPDDNPTYKIPSNETVDMKNYVLPMMIKVTISFKFIESRGETQSKRFYSFEPQTI